MAAAALVAAVAAGATAREAAAARVTSREATVERAAQSVTSSELATHLGVLAADDMEGRGLETRGNARAAEYIAGVLSDRGIPPALDDTYFQSFALNEVSLGQNSVLTVSGRGGCEMMRVTPGTEFYPVPESAALSVTAPAAFDLASAHGRIFVDRATGAALQDRLEAARRHGAAALIVVSRQPEPLDRVWPTGDAYQLVDQIAGIPVARISAALADRLRALAAGSTVTLTVDVTRRELSTRNVVAAIAGGDSARREELVVVGAHLDHEGVHPHRGVFNGADDDASGVGAVLEVAEAFALAAAEGARPARTVVFGFWNGEEDGLFGSRYYVAHPSPAGRPVANLNLDMIGRDEDIPDDPDPRYAGLAPTSAKANVNVLHVLGYSYSPDLAAAVRAANEGVRLDVRTEYDGGSHNLLRRSDHWPFLERGIPALFLTTGLHRDYHTPQDDVERINFVKLERVARLTFGAAWRVADAPAPPRFATP